MEIRNSKRLHWQKWCAVVKVQNPWKLLRVLKSRAPPMVDALRVDGRLVFENQEKAQVLQKVFFPELRPSSLRFHSEVDATWNTARPPGESVESWVSIKELRRACFKMRSQAATGVDRLSILLVQRCFRELMIFLQRLFTASLRLGVFPTTWKIASVIALCKPGKSSYAEARAYRSISLLNHLSKMLEVIVNSRLKNWIEAHSVLSPF